MVFRRDSENTYLIVMVQPEEDKGKGYLKTGKNLSASTTPFHAASPSRARKTNSRT